MAAPYIAGVAALYIGEYGGREYFGPGFAKMLRDRIASSGKTLPWTGLDTWYNFTAPPFQVGTGLVDAWKVLKYKTELGYEPFALMDKQFFNPHWKINITNHGLLRERYHFKLEPAAGVNILDDFFGIEILYGLKPYRIVPNVTLPGPIVVEPGETKEVEYVLPKQVESVRDTNLLPASRSRCLMSTRICFPCTAVRSGCYPAKERSSQSRTEACPFFTILSRGIRR